MGTCQREMAMEGGRYPRTCPTCGLSGKCDKGLPDLNTIQQERRAREKREQSPQPTRVEQYEKVLEGLRGTLVHLAILRDQEEEDREGGAEQVLLKYEVQQVIHAFDHGTRKELELAIEQLRKHFAEGGTTV